MSTSIGATVVTRDADFEAIARVVDFDLVVLARRRHSPGVEKPTATIRTTPEDFFVEEIPAYDPSGAGEHLYVTFEKRGLDTMFAVRALAKALGVDARDAGTAGLKDRWAVTVQTASFPFPAAKAIPPIESIAVEGVRVLRAARHANKLRTGHLRGNRFRLVLRDLDATGVDDLAAKVRALGESGVPNFFGEQRFGRHGDNVEVAVSWLTGRTKPPRDRRLMRLHFSAVQSELFHRVLRRRVDEGTWDVPLAGDLVQLRHTRSLFRCTDPEADRLRAKALEIDPTGPIFGAKMRWPEGAPLALEREILQSFEAPPDLFERWSALGEGARRPLRIVPEHVVATPLREQPGSLQVQFVLPKGAYATTVLGTVFILRDRAREGPADETEEST